MRPSTSSEDKTSTLEDGTTLYGAPEIYDLEYGSYAGDLAFYREVARRASPNRVLDLGCGTGRITLPLAQLGLRVDAVDVSPAMLERLRKRLESLPPHEVGPVRLWNADLRRFRGPAGAYGAIIAAFNTLQHLNPRGLCEALRSARLHLAPSGRLAFDLFAPVDPIQVPQDGDYVGADPLPRPGASSGWVNEQRTRYHSADRLLQVDYRYRLCDAGGREIERRDMALYQRQWQWDELQEALVAECFEVTALYGDVDLSPLRVGSPRILAVARLAEVSRY